MKQDTVHQAACIQTAAIVWAAHADYRADQTDEQRAAEVVRLATLILATWEKAQPAAA
jgi:hypothetical protein